MSINFKNVFSSRYLLVILHVVAWAVFVFYPFIFFQIRVVGNEFYYKQIINAAFLAGVFYFNAYYLFPRIIQRKKLVRNILLLIVIIVFIPVQQYVLEFYLFNRFEDHIQIVSPISHEKIAEFHSLSPRKEIRVIIRKDSLASNKLFGVPLPAHSMFFPEIFQTSFSSLFFVLLLSGFVSVARELFKTEKKRKELENQRLNAELAFLKSQVNPHFFFNTLNTIYLLAHKKSDQTEHVVMKLSEIMRYMIYESNATEVSLSQEIKYLSDYIDLQKMRLSKKIKVEFTVNGDAQNLLIAPMMLIPFVENAFKHGISYVEDSFIYISLTVQNSSVLFETRNKLLPRKKEMEQSSGVGLVNVQKRLELIYPGRHTLHISRENEEYKINLLIQLKND